MNFKLKFLNTTVGSLVLIAVGGFFYGAAVGLFFEPYSIAPGGVTGIAIIISHFCGAKVGLTAFILNSPLLVAALLRLGGKFFCKTLLGIVVSSISTDLFSQANPLLSSKLLSAVFGGVIMSAAIGVIFKSGGTTGGSDIVVRFLRKKYPHLSSGVIFLIIDGVISVLSGVLFKSPDSAAYALCALFAAAKTLNLILYGADEAKLVLIFSSKTELIKDTIINKLDLGLSLVEGVGGFSGKGQPIILCAVSKQRLFSLSRAVRDVDGGAFMIVCPASEILGEGFKQKSEQLI